MEPAELKAVNLKIGGGPRSEGELAKAEAELQARISARRLDRTIAEREARLPPGAGSRRRGFLAGSPGQHTPLAAQPASAPPASAEEAELARIADPHVKQLKANKDAARIMSIIGKYWVLVAQEEGNPKAWRAIQRALMNNLGILVNRVGTLPQLISLVRSLDEPDEQPKVPASSKPKDRAGQYEGFLLGDDVELEL